MLRMKNVHKRYMWDDETKKRNKISRWGDRNVNVKDGGGGFNEKKKIIINYCLLNFFPVSLDWTEE